MAYFIDNIPEPSLDHGIVGSHIFLLAFRFSVPSLVVFAALPRSG
jgi:hypothetical protein